MFLYFVCTRAASSQFPKQDSHEQKQKNNEKKKGNKKTIFSLRTGRGEKEKTLIVS